MSVLDIDLGVDPVNEKPITLSFANRRLSTLIKGPLGCGKKDKFLIPMIQQDIMAIKHTYKNLDRAGEYLNGLTIFENDHQLGKIVLMLANDYNLPKGVIQVIDPNNPDTASIDLMQGEADEVAEAMMELVSQLSNSAKEEKYFVEQIQRNHLKHHVFLLKMHAPEKEVTIEMLLDMYKEPRIVHDMHMQLKKRFPKDFETIDRIENREEYTYWQILSGIDQWFDSVIVPDSNVSTNQYMDEQAFYTKGLRETLNYIASNEMIRKILFNDVGFSFEEHLGQKGGVLLINTAKDSFGVLSNVIGKVLLLKASKATIKRKYDSEGFHHLLIDDCLDFWTSSFIYSNYLARKTRLIITCATNRDDLALVRFDKGYATLFQNKFEFDSEEFGIDTPWKCHVQQIEKGTSKVFYLQ